MAPVIIVGHLSCADTDAKDVLSAVLYGASSGYQLKVALQLQATLTDLRIEVHDCDEVNPISEDSMAVCKETRGSTISELWSLRGAGAFFMCSAARR